jgi:hypothetical protein
MIGRFAQQCRIDAIGRRISAGDGLDHFGLITAPEELAMHHPPTNFSQRGLVGIKVFAVLLVKVSEELPHIVNRLGRVVILRRKGHLSAGERNTYPDRLPQRQAVGRSHQANQHLQQREPLALIVSDPAIFLIARHKDWIETAHGAARSAGHIGAGSHDRS